MKFINYKAESEDKNNYYEFNDELKVKNAPYNEYCDIKDNRTDRLLGRISVFLLNHKVKYVYEIQEVKTMAEIIINKEKHECAPAVAAYINELKAENARLEELYQKSVGVIAATDCVECKDELKTENEALKLLIEWAEECDFGYDNFPEEYERYKDEIEGMGYTEGMIHIAKRVYQQKIRDNARSNARRCEKECERMRLIDADYVKSKLNKSALGGHLHYYVCGVIDDAPTIDAKPVKHGRWIETNDDTKKRCTGCNVIHLIAQYPHGNANYCPNCGAKMDGGAEDECKKV